MHAIVYRDFGSPDVLRLEELERPVVRENEVLIRVRAAALNPLDRHLMRGGPLPMRLLLGLHKMKRPGVDVAGEIEAIGPGVTRFKPGDRVFGTCKGALADFASAPEKAIVALPGSISFDRAAAIPIAGLTALQGLRDKGKIRPGQRVLIIGAAGGVGTFAVQLARHFGAHVTAVCSTTAIGLVRSLGANEVIDYSRDDFLASDDLYDLILDMVCNRPLKACRRMLRPGGIYVGAGGGGPNARMSGILLHLVQMLLFSRVGSRRVTTFIARSNAKDLAELAELVASRTILPVIDRHYDLSHTQEAMRYLEEGHAHGKVIVLPEVLTTA